MQDHSATVIRKLVVFKKLQAGPVRFASEKAETEYWVIYPDASQAIYKLSYPYGESVFDPGDHDCIFG